MKIVRVVLAGVLFIGPAYPDPLPTEGRVIIAPEDTGVRLNLPPAAVQQLSASQNPYKEDLQIHLVHRPQDETGRILRSYSVVLTKASTGEPVHRFSFSSPVVLQLGYWSLFGRSSNASDPWTPVEDVRSVLAAYWNNGNGFIRVETLSLHPDQSIGLSIHNAGIYQIRAVTAPASFHLAQGSPYPRIITPNAGQNRRAFFFFENPGTEEVMGTIFDYRGLKVRELRINAQSPTANCLVWDGRDDNGHVVPAGPYLYKVSGGDATVTGGLVVAR